MSTSSPISRPQHGLWRIVPSVALTESIAQSGFDFQILDCEHGAYDYATLLPDILACERHGCSPWVRVSGTDKVEVQRCLDLGAQGLVFPQLETCDDFERAAAMMDYAPAGTRGFNPFVRAGGYGLPTGTPATPARFVPIIETMAAAEHIEAIVKIERVDLFYLGAYDLSAQLGCPGRMDAPELISVMERIIAVCADAGKPVGAMALSPEAAVTWVSRGVQALVHGVEIHRIRQAMGDTIDAVAKLRLPPEISPFR